MIGAVAGTKLSSKFGLQGKCKLPNPSKILNAARSGLSKVKSGASKIISKAKQVISKGKKYKSTIKKVMKRVATSAAKGGAESAIQSKMTNSNVKNGTISGMISGAISGLGGTGFAVAGSAIGGFVNKKLDGKQNFSSVAYGVMSGGMQWMIGASELSFPVSSTGTSLDFITKIGVNGMIGLTNKTIGFAANLSGDFFFDSVSEKIEENIR